ncbi:MAG: hypothetical protein J6V49_02870 [Bacteroidales bacterium]|nr:hypothetical protein [Bacteroidales bacterium]
MENLVPIYYDYATALNNAVSPAALKPKDNLTTQYYIRYLLKRAMSVFEFENVPKNWDINYVRYVLWCFGHLVVIKSPTVGVIPQACTLGGFGVYRTPTFANVANPALPIQETGRYWLSAVYDKKKNPTIKGTGVLVKLQPDYLGIVDICTITAERLAYMHEALIMNLANSKMAYVIGAQDKAAAETFKAAIDQIQEGNFAVAVGPKLWDKETGNPLWQGFSNNLRANYIATDILENMRSELNDFNNFIGIPSTNYNKKAHMTVDEINANDVETESLSDIMFETLKKCFNDVNAQFGLDIVVKKRYKVPGKVAGGEANADV